MIEFLIIIGLSIPVFVFALFIYAILIAAGENAKTIEDLQIQVKRLQQQPFEKRNLIKAIKKLDGKKARNKDNV